MNPPFIPYFSEKIIGRYKTYSDENDSGMKVSFPICPSSLRESAEYKNGNDGDANVEDVLRREVGRGQRLCYFQDHEVAVLCNSSTVT